VLYADDILLIAPSVFALQKLLHVVDDYLLSIDMCLNTKKSICMRIGPQFGEHCDTVTTLGGDKLHFVDSIRYLGVTIQSGKKWKVSLSNNKSSFYKTANTVFSKIGRNASEQTVAHLIDSKCVPALLYGLDASPINVTVKRTLDFICHRTLMKIFRTRSIDIVNYCCDMLNIRLYSSRLESRKMRFLCKYSNSSNFICQLFSNIAVAELTALGHAP
jgi:hypothetical protein